MSQTPKDEYVPRKYLDHFQRDGNGKYVFTGTEYEWALSHEEWRKKTILITVLTVALFGCALVPGFSGTSAMLHGSYTILAFLLELAAAIFLPWALGHFIAAGENIRDYVFKKSVDAMPRRCVFAGIATILSGIALCVFCLLNHSFEPGLFLLFAAKAAELVLACFLRKQTLTLRENYHKKDNGR